jgi:hypothetical protein
LITPKGLLNIHCQAMAITAVGRAQGPAPRRRLRDLPERQVDQEREGEAQEEFEGHGGEDERVL